MIGDGSPPRDPVEPDESRIIQRGIWHAAFGMLAFDLM
jgi:hypothetical protein